MLLDCDRCAVRDVQCGDCVVPVLLGEPPGGHEVDEAQRRALDVLADGGLVPRLRLVPTWLPSGSLDPAARHGPPPGARDAG